MIAHLRGRILEKNPSHVILEAAGVGYEVTISVPSFSGLPAEGAEVSLYIHTHVREDTLALYGFLRREEKQRVPVLHDRDVPRRSESTVEMVN